MDNKDIYDVLDKVGISCEKLYDSNRKYIQISCPFAKWSHKKRVDRNPSFTIYLGSLPYYKCYTCHEVGPLWSLFWKLGSLLDEKKLIEIGNDILSITKDDPASRVKNMVDKFGEIAVKEKEKDSSALHRWIKEMPSIKIEKKAIDYLEKRSVNSTLILDKIELLWDRKENRIVFPVFNLDGKFIGAVGRCIDESEEKRYRNYWGSDLSASLGFVEKKIDVKKLVLVEGPFDLFRTYCNLVKLNLENEFFVVCSFTSKCSRRQFEIIERLGMSVYVLYDDDPSGNKGGEEVIYAIEGKVPLVIRVKPVFGKDAGNLDEKELQKIIKRF